MSKKIKPNVVAAGMTIAERLRAAETAIDQALAATAELNGTIPMARLQAEVAAECGHRAMEHASESQQLLMQARAKMVSAHKMFARTSDSLGFEPHAFGNLYGKPSAQDTSRPALHIVSERAA